MRKITVDVKWDQKVVDSIRTGAFEGIVQATEYLLQASNQRVPLDEGTLQASGAASYDEATLTGQVSYDTPYAVRLHEHPEYRFQRGREGKWLQNTFRLNGPHAMKLVRRAIRRKAGEPGAD